MNGFTVIVFLALALIGAVVVGAVVGTFIEGLIVRVRNWWRDNS